MRSPLIERLITELGYPLLDEANIEAFVADQEVVLFCTEDPKRFPESNDVAVVLPELEAAFPGRFVPAVVDASIERKIQNQYGFKVWPALVFLRDGQYLGTITKIQDWAVYQHEIASILASEPSRAPGVGVPVASA